MPSPLSTYQNDAILSASPSKLLTMLYDRLILDLNLGREALLNDDIAVATYRIGHAGDIVSALASSLRLDAWDGAQGLLDLYAYISVALMRANLNRDPALLDESVNLIAPLRDAWREASDQLAGKPAWETADGSADGSRVIAVA